MLHDFRHDSTNEVVLRSDHVKGRSLASVLC